ncbi:MAG: L-glutamate gamma-semialdehyde dehydrogenase [Candidatus Methanofastidiosa archaeon]|nr:L-glutamate gamma-semialdehyde dehydrogenase [Candidatus Methanofastidiosa archaeon]
MNVKAFANEPLSDFAEEGTQQAFLDALAAVRKSFGAEYHMVVAGEERASEHVIESRNPSRPEEIVGIVHAGSKAVAAEAVEAAHVAFSDWSHRHAKHRAACLFKAAALLRRRRHLLSATMVYEVGKSWAEADADTAEAIDFLEYYAREALSLFGDRDVAPHPGELTTYRYLPLGVGAIIPPWNFPSAILTGMTSAALVTGNTAVLKPASDAPVTGARVTAILHEAGIPREVLSLVPGSGKSVGEELVIHPLVRFVSFTGSREVGTRIYQQASIVWSGQRWLKRVVTEMGGKDALIIDDPCDIEAAVRDTVASAFGFQGQKCSACSRAIVVESVYKAYMRPLIDAVKRLTVGDVEDPGMYMGPLSSRQAFEKVLSYIEEGKREATLAHGGNSIGEKGFFVEPTVFVDVPPDARIAQEEIFGPVLSVIKASDFEEALSIANGTEYGLTGGIHSLDREHIERAKRSFHVGNLYVNRKITGALVGVQPFGGFNMSGTCSKAGGPDYLSLFVQGQSIAERL